MKKRLTAKEWEFIYAINSIRFKISLAKAFELWKIINKK